MFAFVEAWVLPVLGGWTVVPTAKTALPATLAALLLRATMWLSPVCILALCHLDSTIVPQGNTSGAPCLCCHHTRSRWTELLRLLLVHLYFLFVQMFREASCLQTLCAFLPMKLHKLTDNTDRQTGAQHIIQTIGSTWYMAHTHLTSQILLYECKPIKWSSSTLFAVASCSCSLWNGGAGTVKVALEIFVFPSS